MATTNTTTQTQAQTGSSQAVTAQQKIQAMRELFADAPELGKKALENALREVAADISKGQLLTPIESAGRTGSRVGKVSELTIIVPLAPGGAKRLRAFLQLLGGNVNAGKVGTVHDMRFVFLDNDTKMLFATAYDGDWDAYIDDFATKIPDSMDILFCNCEGWPGIHSPVIKDYLVKFQLTADAWYVANPNLTVAETRRLEKVGKALDEFLDKIG